MLPDSTDSTAYGLPKNNRSFVVDPRTEFDYFEIEAALVDIAALTRTCPRAWARIDATGGVSCVLVAHDSVWGNDDAVKPTATYNGNGDYTITWPATVSDLNPTVARRVARNVSFRTGWLQNHSNLSNITSKLSVSTSNSIAVLIYDDNVAADIDFTVFVL